MFSQSGRKDAAKKLGEQLQEILNGLGVDRNFINQFSSALSSVESMGELAATIEHYAKLAAPFAGAASVILILKGVFTAYQQSKQREELQRACQQLINLQQRSLAIQNQQMRLAAGQTLILNQLLLLNKKTLQALDIEVDGSAITDFAISNEAAQILRHTTAIEPTALVLLSQQLMNDMIKLLDFFHQERRAELSIESSLENITAASDLFSIIQYYQEAMKPMIFEGSIEGIEHSYGRLSPSYGLLKRLYGSDEIESLRRQIRDNYFRKSINQLISQARNVADCSVDYAANLLIAALCPTIELEKYFTPNQVTTVRTLNNHYINLLQDETLLNQVNALMINAGCKHMHPTKVQQALHAIINRAFIGEAYHCYKHLKGWRAAPFEVMDGLKSIVTGPWQLLRHPIRSLQALPTLPLAILQEAYYHPLRIGGRLVPSMLVGAAVSDYPIGNLSASQSLMTLGTVRAAIADGTAMCATSSASSFAVAGLHGATAQVSACMTMDYANVVSKLDDAFTAFENETAAAHMVPATAHQPAATAEPLSQEQTDEAKLSKRKGKQKVKAKKRQAGDHARFFKENSQDRPVASTSEPSPLEQWHQQLDDQEINRSTNR